MPNQFCIFNPSKSNNTPTPPVISCANARSWTVIYGYNVIGMNPTPTVDIYVNSILIASNVDATFINQAWYSNSNLSQNAADLNYNVSGTSSNTEDFSNSSNENITFRFVPKSDGLYNGEVYTAKDALRIHNTNMNNSAYKDPITGVLTFCLAVNILT